MRVVATIDVDDLERAIAFYRDGLGLTVERRLFGDTVAEMRGASTTIYLGVHTAGGSPAPGSVNVRDYRRHWTPVHLDFLVDSIDAAVARACAAGATLERGIEQHGAWKLAPMSDPFGNGFCLVEGWPY